MKKDSDIELMERIEPKAEVYKQRTQADYLAKQIEQIDRGASQLQNLFLSEIENRQIQIENLEDNEIEKHQELFEVQELKRLEAQIKKVEEEKLNLIRSERHTEADLL